jgi:hypothetical protein
MCCRDDEQTCEEDEKDGEGGEEILHFRHLEIERKK